MFLRLRAYPEILDAVSALDSERIVSFSVGISDPVLASLALLLAGLILLGKELEYEKELLVSTSYSYTPTEEPSKVHSNV